MTTRSYFGFKKSKAYGLCGAVLATVILASGTSVVFADQVSPTSVEAGSLTTSEVSNQMPLESSVAEGVAPVVASTELTAVEGNTQAQSSSELNKQVSTVAQESSLVTESSEVAVHSEDSSQASIASSSSTASSEVTQSLSNTESQQSETTVEEQPEAVRTGFRSANGQSTNRLDQTTTTFLDGIKQGSLDGIKEGILPSITAAQAILESGWGKSALAKAPNYNLFGIKASSDWTGETVTVPTKEYLNGQYVTVDAAFRKYPSWNDSIVDHAKFFTSTEWRKNNYKKVVGQSDYKIAAQEMKNAGYATDPAYSDKLIRVIETYGLNEWDKIAVASRTSTHSKDSLRSVATNSRQSQVPSGKVAYSNLDNDSGSYEVIISNVVAPTGLKEIVVPSWSDKNGQDDIVWYKASKQSNGDYKVTVKVSEHKGDGGLYRSDVYLVDAQGKYHGLGGVQPTLNLPVPKGTVRLGTVNGDNGFYEVIISNVVAPTGLTEVVVPSWSDKNGQDDIVWYKANKQSNGDYKATVRVSDHKGDNGLYRSDVYLVDAQGKYHGLGGVQPTLNLPVPKGTVRLGTVNNDNGSYEVIISNVVAPTGLTEVVVPSWSDKNGQDDIVWYKASKQSNGDYKVIVRSSEHKGDGGLYRSDVYLVDAQGKYHGLGGVQPRLNITKVSGNMAIVNTNNDKGTFDVVIRDVANPTGIKSIVVPIWSDKNGQDDIVWHQVSKQDDGSFKVNVSASQHKWDSGQYHVHAYIIDSNDKYVGLAFTTTDVVAPKKVGSASRGDYDVLNRVVYLDAGHGGYDPGASYFGITEKGLTLAIQNRVKSKLEAAGFQVVTTRTTDTFVDLLDRSRNANASDSDIFVSIHINASGSSAAQGIETYYYQYYSEYPSRINAANHNNATRLNMSANLANAIQSDLISSTGATNLGVKRQTFAVLRETTAPAVLLELGFLSNPTEAGRLNSADYQEKLANAIVNGIKRYYTIYS